MDYNSVEDILNAGITNMEVIRDNIRNDDGVDTLTGVDWFRFNDTLVSNIYVSGNSYIGFGANTEHLKINRRDSAVYYVYREEGTLYGWNRFLKIRVIGYTAYSSTSDDSKIEYDIIIWDTGDISLHMVTIPTSNNDGVYSLTLGTTQFYTIPTVDAPDVTFVSQNDVNSKYVIAYELIEILPPFDSKYLIGSEGVIYTIVDNQLVALTETELTGELFLHHGLDEISNSSLLPLLDNPQIYYWQDNDMPLLKRQALVSGTVHTQTIISNQIDLSDPTILGIDRVVVNCEGSPLFQVSFDDKQSWKMWNGTNWDTVYDNVSGMTKEVFEAINNTNWSALYEGANSFYIKVILNENELTQSITDIYVDFAN